MILRFQTSALPYAAYCCVVLGHWVEGGRDHVIEICHDVVSHDADLCSYATGSERHLDVVMLHRGIDAMAILSLEDVTPAPKVAASAPQSGDIEAAGDGTKCRRVAL
jgi:hypothetical protein